MQKTMTATITICGMPNNNIGMVTNGTKTYQQVLGSLYQRVSQQVTMLKVVQIYVIGIRPPLIQDMMLSIHVLIFLMQMRWHGTQKKVVPIGITKYGLQWDTYMPVVCGLRRNHI